MSLIAWKRGNFKNASFVKRVEEENFIKGFLGSAKGALLLRAPNFIMSSSG